MTRERREQLLWLLGTLAGLIFTAGVTLATVRYQIAGKLDAQRFMSDSIARDYRADKRDTRLDGIQQTLQQLNATWTRLYCRDHPHDSVCP